MSYTKLVKIDGNTLKKCIEKRGLTCSKAARELGFNPNFINKAVADNQINQPAIKLLEAVFNIKPEEYEIKDESEPIESKLEVAEPVIDYEKLENVIYKAVYEAVSKAWKK